jgi:hypothetical protein
MAEVVEHLPSKHEALSSKLQYWGEKKILLTPNSVLPQDRIISKL